MDQNSANPEEHRSKRRKVDTPTFTADGFTSDNQSKSVVRAHAPRLVSEFTRPAFEPRSASATTPTGNITSISAGLTASTRKISHKTHIVSEFEGLGDVEEAIRAPEVVHRSSFRKRKTSMTSLPHGSRKMQPPDLPKPSSPPGRIDIRHLKPPDLTFLKLNTTASASSSSLATPRKLTSGIPPKFPVFKPEEITPKRSILTTSKVIKSEPSDVSGLFQQQKQRHLSEAPPSIHTDASHDRKIDLRRISNTRLALATNVDTDAGQAEVMALTLQGQRAAEDGLQQRGAPNIPPELLRGLMASPGKGERVRGQKFLKGGLAERAQTLLSRAQTAFSLWQRELSTHVKTSLTPPSVTCTRAPELRVKIVEILQLIYPPEHRGHRRRVSSVRGSDETIIGSEGGGDVLTMLKAHPNGALPQAHLPRSALVKVERPTGALGRPEVMLLLLSFSRSPSTSLFPSTSTSNAALGAISSPQHLAVGRELFLWEPWEEIEFLREEDGDDGEGNVDEGFSIKKGKGKGKGREDEERGDLETEVLSRLRRDRTRALLCSRFLVIRKAGQ